VQEGQGGLQGAHGIGNMRSRWPRKVRLTEGQAEERDASSLANREKAQDKPVMVIMGIRGKKKQSLREKQKCLRAHIDRTKWTHH